MSEDLLDSLHQDFKDGKYQIKGQQIKIGRMDANDPAIRELASQIGLRID
jgi:hypothetical protein